MKQLCIIDGFQRYNVLYLSLLSKAKAENVNTTQYSLTEWLQTKGYKVSNGVFKYTDPFACWTPTIDFEDDKEYLRFLLEFS
jgi:hypothetical protein